MSPLPAKYYRLLPGHVVFLLVNVVCSGYSALYPPFFNAALNKPVTTFPDDVTCGTNAIDQFCESSNAEQYVLSCFQEDCASSCSHGNTFPGHNTVSTGFISQDYNWGTCISRDGSMDYPTSEPEVGFKFQGSGNGCAMPLDQGWLSPVVFLTNVWDVSFTFWVYSQVGNSAGTLLDAYLDESSSGSQLRITINSQQLYIYSGSQTVTDPNWVIQDRIWTHIGIQVYNQSLAVSINGSQVQPAYYNTGVLSNSNARTWIVGKSHSAFDPFMGYLHDFRVYRNFLVNRGIASVYNGGTLEETRIQTPCLCPKTHPRLKPSDETSCIQNSGEGRSPTEMYRLNRQAHPREFVNDGKESSTWVSSTPLEDVSVEIDLGHQLEVRHLDIVLYSPVPLTIIIDRKANESAPWMTWQYYSERCESVGRGTDDPLVSEDDVNCRKLITFLEQYIYSGARIRLDLLENRPGVNGSVISPLLRSFLTARFVRVTLKGHPFTTNDMHKYHAISEIIVNATCDCNGRSNECNFGTDDYTCVCDPGSFASGARCDECLTPCDVSGTVPRNGTCDDNDDNSDECQCKTHVTGNTCNTCAEGHYNLTRDNPDGCSPCQCNTNGTLNGHDVCDAITGQCACKDNVIGRYCDECEQGFVLFSRDHNEGCLDCNCHVAGTLDGNTTCDVTTGVCSCKDYVIGRTCNQCAEGTFNLLPEHDTGCEPCNCDTDFGAANSSCDVISGQCHCLPHVIGLLCQSCDPDFYAENQTEARWRGCDMPCDCDVIGSLSNECEGIGGQCSCKTGSAGRRCDSCAPGYYNFGQTSDDSAACLECDCATKGTLNGSNVCDDVTGQCPCGNGYIGRRCDLCLEGYFGFEEEAGCQPCACAIRGTVGSTLCDRESGQCQCVPDMGDPDLGGRTCLSYIDDMIPTYGPMSGGTKISMTTGYLGSLSGLRIYLGTDQQCNINSTASNLTALGCTSASIHGNPEKNRIAYTEQTIRLTWGPDDTVLTSHSFTYRNDPIIDDIAPLHTFLSGGIKLTVSGSYIDSVMFPRMTVSMVYTPRSGNVQQREFQSGCDVQDSATMHCPTPELELPEEFQPRTKRDVRGHDSAFSSHPRYRRQSDPEEVPDDVPPLNNDELNFYLGFILDGLETYKNMSYVNPDLGIIRVYSNPELEMFSEGDHVKVFRLYWPIQESSILIKGRNLNHGATANDYVIQIGTEYCTEVDLYSEFLSCSPPKVSPDPIQYATEYPEVVVTVGSIQFLVGYLRYESSIWYYEPFKYGIIGAICAIVLIIVVTVICCVVCRRRESDQQSTDTASKSSNMSKDRARSFISAYENKDGEITPYLITSGTDVVSSLPGELRVAILDREIDAKSVQLGKLVGEGHFGQVYLGFYTKDERSTPETVAIKTLKDKPDRNRQDVIHFLEEATIMKDFQNNNVLSLVGVIITGDTIQVVLPYMENGDLKTFIGIEENLLTVGELLHFGLQIASGMSYLADQRFVHRDLACRNCMVNKNLIVKVADFGLSRDIYEQDYYRVGTSKRPLPVKWMAIESLHDGIWTTKSDVWSYGVVLWELLTRACPPYPDVDGFDIKTYLLRGNRMDRPDYAPDEIYSLMLNSWQEDPDRRPNFRQIRDRMSYFLNEASSQTFVHEKHGQQVPSIVHRKHKYLELTT